MIQPILWVDYDPGECFGWELAWLGVTECIYSLIHSNNKK